MSEPSTPEGTGPTKFDNPAFVDANDYSTISKSDAVTDKTHEYTPIETGLASSTEMHSRPQEPTNDPDKMHEYTSIETGLASSTEMHSRPQEPTNDPDKMHEYTSIETGLASSTEMHSRPQEPTNDPDKMHEYTSIETGLASSTEMHSTPQEPTNDPRSPDTPENSSHHPADKPYPGMGKDDLLKFSSMPFWERLRKVFIAIVLIGWLALIVTIVVLVLVYPRCRDPLPREWWQEGVVYRVYVRSFQDSNDDGVGDLQGLQSRLDYLKDLGVTILSLSSIYNTSNNSISDLDIINHTEIDHVFGNMTDFEDLVNNIHERGMKIVLDFIPNLTSQNHSWFLDSSSSTNVSNPEHNYYVWADRPNNWRTVNNKSAWSNGTGPRNMYYLHQFRQSHPDLNLRSTQVKDELKNILLFWLKMGVDGFYIRDSGFLFEDYDLRDEVMLENKSNKDAYNSYNHTYTYGLPEIHDMFARWRAFLDDYGNANDKYIFLSADRTGTIEEIMAYYGRFNRDGVDFPLNLFCLELNESTGGKGVQSMVQNWLQKMPKGGWANWLGGTDSSERLIDRLGDLMLRPFLTLIMLLPGTPVVYYGDEIGMKTLQPLTLTEMNDGGRNLSMRSPMQWSNSTNAGFCNCTDPWMAVNPDYDEFNVEIQASKDGSIYKLFTTLTSLRVKYEAFRYGDYNEAVVDDDVFSFVRDYDGVKGFLVALNFANKTLKKDFYNSFETIPKKADVVLVTGKDVVYKEGDTISSSGVELGPYQGVVLSWEFVAKEL